MNPTPRRPIVPAGYGIAATPPTSADWSAIAAKIAASRNYWIASTRADGRPHAMPVWGVVVDGALFFSTDPKSMKGRNLAARPAVVVHLESGDDVVVLEGDAVPVTDSVILARYADAYEAKYNFRPDPADPDGITLTLRPSACHTWLESDFVNSAVRWTFPRDNPLTSNP